MFRLSNKKALSPGLRCRVLLLVPGEEIEISYNNNSTGQDLLNDVFSHLDVVDKDYYGLKIYDQIQWLDLTKLVVKQTKGMSDIVFSLRFKYYPAEPALLANESTRYYLYLQLRNDLLEGRIKTNSQETQAYLIACILQSELGDAGSSIETSQDDNYVADYKFLPNQGEDLEWEAIKLHQSEDFLGLKPADAELNFLKKASQLECYGIDPYPVKEGNSHNHFLIGVNYLGISTYQDSRRTNLFTWAEIERISLDGKLVLINRRKVDKKGEKVSKKSSSLFAFRCPSHEHAHNFWKIATEHRYFFTLETAPESPIVTNTGGLFKKSHKLKYVGRVEKDLLRDHVGETRAGGVKRSRSLMAKTTSDGPIWQGFNPQGNTINGNNKQSHQSSMKNIYAADSINKTMPSDLNYLREEEEEEGEEYELNDHGGHDRHNELAGHEARKFAAGRASLGSVSKDSPKAAFNRRTVLTTKADASAAAGNAIRRGSQVYLDTAQQNYDFIRASVFLLFFLAAILLIILLISDSDRPNSITVLVKRLNLEDVSNALRNNYYLPLKSVLRQAFGQVFSILDSKLI